MTDISRETSQLDGHMSSVLQKRLNRLAALPFDISPAQGPRVVPKKADFYASYVRDQMTQLPRFKQAITQLAWAVFDGVRQYVVLTNQGLRGIAAEDGKLLWQHDHNLGTEVVSSPIIHGALVPRNRRITRSRRFATMS